MKPMTDPEVLEFIAHNRLGVLSLASLGRAYGVPLYYGFDGRSIYFGTRPGEKTAYLQATQEACFTIVRVVSLDEWASVQAFGLVEPVESGQAYDAAIDALLAVPLPPEWGVSVHGEPLRSDRNMRVYRLKPTHVTGRKSARPLGMLSHQDIAQTGM